MTHFSLGETYHGFRLDASSSLSEIASTVYLFTHVKLGCQALAIKNDDSNKTFCLSFRTIPTDSTGVAHILEHAVLMGSKKYPVKDVFGEINKGGLLTFLNAMTGADSTYYPFATRNVKEYFNIMDVYCDVCFHPLLLRSTFEQEGWHYHLEKEDAPLQFMGVVFNEMKGAFSDPLRTLFQDIHEGLMPGSTFAHESGGDPRDIPDLTYDAFKAFHADHYHPSNCTLFFYGNAPLEEELAFVEERFLSQFASPVGRASLVDGKPMQGPLTIADGYPVQPGSDLAGKTYISLASIVGTVENRSEDLAFQVIANILFNSDASPLKNAIVSSGLGKDFGGLCMSGTTPKTIMLTYLVGADARQAEEFFTLYRKCLEEMVAEGIDRELILSELNTFEFKVREEMNKPQRGLGLIFRAQEAMKYGLSPFEALCVDELLAAVRHRALEEGWFEALIRQHLLENAETVRVILEPDPQKGEQNQQEEKERLSAFAKTLNTNERLGLVKETQELMDLQLAAPTEEELRHLPRLPLSEVDAVPLLHVVRESSLVGHTFLQNELATNGVVYFDIGFDCAALSAEDLLYLDLFAVIVTEIGTKKSNHVQFAKTVNRLTGGFNHSFRAYANMAAPAQVRPILWLHVKALSHFLEEAMGMTAEVLAEVDFSNRRRIEEIIQREFAWAEHGAQSEGHDLAARRAFSHLNTGGQYNEYVQGMAAYQQLKILALQYDQLEEGFLNALERIRNLLFRRPGMLFAITAEAADIERFTVKAPALLSALPEEPVSAAPPVFAGFPVTQAFTSAAEVVFNVQACSFFQHTGTYAGDFEVLKTWMSREYLWNAVRQKGGAYGCFTRFSLVSGSFGIISYRDPQVANTYKVYADLAEAVRKLELREDSLHQLVIGAYNSINPHQGPAAKGATARDHYLSGITLSFQQERIESVLATEASALRRYADQFEQLNKGTLYRVSVGNAEKIQADGGLFSSIEEL